MSFDFTTYRQKVTSVAEFFVILIAFFLPISIAITNILLTAILVLFIIGGDWFKKIDFIFSHEVIIFPLLLFGLFLLGTLHSSAPHNYMLMVLHKYSKLAFIPLLLPFFAKERTRKIAINAFLLAICITLLFSFLKKYGLPGSHINLRGYDEVFHNRIDTGFFIAFAAFILLNKLISANKKWFWGILFLIVSFSELYLYTSRTGYVVFFALMLLFVWQQLKWRGLITAILAAPIIVGVVYFTSPTFSSGTLEAISNITNYQHQLSVNDTSAGARMDFVKNSVDLFKKHPIIGSGTGNAIPEYSKSFTLPPEFVATGLGTLHDEYVMVAIQLGGLGLIILILMFYYQFALAADLPKAHFKNLAQGCVVACALFALSDSVLFLSAPGHFFIYFTALLYAMNPLPKRKVIENITTKIANLSAILITKNEAHDVGNCLESIKDAAEIIVVDSGSSDNTIKVCNEYEARVFVHQDWQGFGVQKNRALQYATKEWVLSIDADEIITPELMQEIKFSIENSNLSAFKIPRKSKLCGKILNYGSFGNDSPIRLFKKDYGTFTNDLVHERVTVTGKIGKLQSFMIHNTYANLEELIAKFNHYSTLKAQLTYRKKRSTTFSKAILHGFWSFVKNYFLKRGFIDGKEGFILAMSNAASSYYSHLKLWYLQKPHY